MPDSDRDEFLTREEIAAANAALDHFPERSTLPTLTANQFLDERNDVVNWHHGEVAHELAEMQLRYAQKDTSRPHLVTLTRHWVPSEWSRHQVQPLTGELFYVTADMARMADYAAQSLPDDLIFSQQLLPAPRGLFRLEQPRRSVDRRGAIGGTAGFGWTPLSGRGENTGKLQTGILFVQYWHRDDAGWRTILQDPDVAALGAVTRLNWENSQFIHYGKSFAKDYTGTARFFAALCLLCQQEVAVRHRSEISRPTLKRTRRLSLPTDLTVITLRHAKHDDGATHASGDREYSVRWFRRGHWRRKYDIDPLTGEKVLRWATYIPVSAYLADRDDLPWKVSTGRRVHRLSR